MELQSVAQILLALCIATSINALVEPINLHVQLQNLHNRIQRKPVSTSRLQIKPTIVGSVLFGIIAIGSLAGISYVVLNVVDLQPITLVVASALIVSVVSLINRMQVDRLHAKISKMKDEFR